MPTGFADTEKIIQERLKNNWTTTPIAYSNVDSRLLEDGDDPWIRCTIVEGASSQHAMGDPTGHGNVRHVGVITIQVFVREHTGTRQSRTYLDTLKSYWQVEDQGLTFRPASVFPVGVVNGWYQTNLDIPYFWNEA